MSAPAVKTWSDGDLVSAADLNEQIKEQLANSFLHKASEVGSIPYLSALREVAALAPPSGNGQYILTCEDGRLAWKSLALNHITTPGEIMVRTGRLVVMCKASVRNPSNSNNGVTIAVDGTTVAGENVSSEEENGKRVLGFVTDLSSGAHQVTVAKGGRARYSDFLAIEMA